MIDSDEESPSISEEKPTHKMLDCKKAEFRTFSRYVCPVMAPFLRQLSV